MVLYWSRIIGRLPLFVALLLSFISCSSSQEKEQPLFRSDAIQERLEAFLSKTDSVASWNEMPIQTLVRIYVRADRDTIISFNSYITGVSWAPDDPDPTANTTLSFSKVSNRFVTVVGRASFMSWINAQPSVNRRDKRYLMQTRKQIENSPYDFRSGEYLNYEAYSVVGSDSLVLISVLYNPGTI